LSIDPDVATTDQPYAFTNDDALNTCDPLGNFAVTASGEIIKPVLAKAPVKAPTQTSPPKAKPSNPPKKVPTVTGSLSASPPSPAVTKAVNDYIQLETDASSGIPPSTVEAFGQICGNLVIVAGCLSGTLLNGVYLSGGVGIGTPGVSLTIGQADGLSAQKAISGWTTCVEGEVIVGAVHCWNTPGNGSSNLVEYSPLPGGGVFVTYGRRLN
jgi:hypothetical protein